MLRLGELATPSSRCCATCAAPPGDLDTFLTRLPPFADAGGPAVSALGQASTAGAGPCA